ncbi:hypothetical protein Ahy_B01g052834 [Arachis hypogaea]|uniref:PB1-like domain-containing protein n=1 Tax=Arachis hypogaea TaxID=3818 RepID=A0A445AQM9_ARAHY|nr:hypothetical protein Ahy_B01g052834 [Arachis hypogaea]
MPSRARVAGAASIRTAAVRKGFRPPQVSLPEKGAASLSPLPLEVAIGQPPNRFRDRCYFGSAVPPSVCNSQKPPTENPFEDDVLTPPTFFPFQDMGAEVTKSLFVIEMLCIVLEYYFCTLAFILIYSVRGIGIVLGCRQSLLHAFSFASTRKKKLRTIVSPKTMGDLITIVDHHGGSFVTKNDDSVVYETDNTDELTGLDEDRLDVFSLRNYYKELGYADIVECWWLIPGRPLKNGLRALSHDNELLEMCYLARMNQGRVYLYFEHRVSQPHNNEVPELIEFTPIALEEDKDAPITIPNPSGSSNDVSTTKFNEEPTVQTQPEVLVQDQEDSLAQAQPESPTQAQPKSPIQAQPNPVAKYNLSKPKPTSTKSTTTNIKPKPKAKPNPKSKLTTSNIAKTNHTSYKSASKHKPKNKPLSSKVTITKPTNKPQPKSTSVNSAKTKPITRSSARSASKIVDSQDDGDRTSSSSDSYDSVEDSLYRPDPFESSNDSDIDGRISGARKRVLKFKHALGSAWKKGKEKVLVKDDGIVIGNSDEEEKARTLKKKKRKDTDDEPSSSKKSKTATKLNRIYKEFTCTYCGVKGHTKRSCAHRKADDIACALAAAAAAVVAKSKSQDGANANVPIDVATTAGIQTVDDPQTSKIDITQPTISQPQIIEQVRPPPPLLTRMDKLPHKRRVTPRCGTNTRS